MFSVECGGSFRRLGNRRFAAHKIAKDGSFVRSENDSSCIGIISIKCLDCVEHQNRTLKLITKLFTSSVVTYFLKKILFLKDI